MTRTTPPNQDTRLSRGGRSGATPHTSNGFVLMEILAYVALLGLLATGVAVSSRMVHDGRSVAAVESRLAWLDAAARRASGVAGGPVTMSFDLTHQEVALQIAGRTPDRASYRFDWPGTLRLQQAWVGGENVVLGDAVVRFGGRGQSDTYGLEFYDQRRGEARWLLVAGGSGQMSALRNRSAMKGVFDALSRRNLD
ncbi:MAG: hypothetical protein AAGG38_00230 [Planctomycetota bacterium]